MTKEEIRAVFDDQYAPHRSFPVNYPELWDLCCSAATTPYILTGIKFANDWLNVPPVKSFLACSRSALEKMYDGKEVVLDDSVKRAIGAFWGTVFKGILGYTEYKSSSVNLPFVNFGKAAVFRGVVSPSEVPEG